MCNVIFSYFCHIPSRTKTRRLGDEAEDLDKRNYSKLKVSKAPSFSIFLSCTARQADKSFGSRALLNSLGTS